MNSTEPPLNHHEQHGISQSIVQPRKIMGCGLLVVHHGSVRFRRISQTLNSDCACKSLNEQFTMLLH